MMRQAARGGLLLLFIGLLSSCTARLIDFTMISSKNIALKYDTSARRVSAKASSIKDAMDKALESAGPGYDMLIDGVVYYSSYYVVVWVIVKYTVEGTPVKSSELRARLGDSGFEDWCRANDVFDPEAANLIHNP